MYFIEDINDSELMVEGVSPRLLYGISTYSDIRINEVFYFANEVKLNSKILIPPDINNYISLHLRLGDKFLETETKYIEVVNDERIFSEEKIHKFIECNYDKIIFFCCDNNNFKLQLKKNIITLLRHWRHFFIKHNAKTNIRRSNGILYINKFNIYCCWIATLGIFYNSITIS